jgi:hypothetical protein
MTGPTDVIIAGTKPFALALFAPVTERAGSRPRIAPEPGTALTLCAASSGVLVVEYEPRWLPALTQLHLQRPGLRVVAALRLGQEGAALELGPLAIEAVPWDGQARSVLPAIERAIGGARAAARTTTGPVASAPAGPPPALDLFKDLGARTVTPALGRVAARPAPVVATEAGAQPALDLFKDLGAFGAGPAVAGLERLPALSMAAPAGDAAWPANGPTAAEAELALRGALDGAADPSSLGVVAAQTALGLTALEREVFKGGAPAVDAELVRHAAILRLRVAAALATTPPPGTPSDGAAVAELLSEIDGLLVE